MYQARWQIPAIPALIWLGTRWSRVWGQPGLHRETVSKTKTNKQQQQKEFRKKKLPIKTKNVQPKKYKFQKVLIYQCLPFKLTKNFFKKT
jgi:hypothetical protein